MPIYHAIGAMSGTSLDGLDLALVQFEVENDSYQWELTGHAFFPYDEKWKGRLQYLPQQSAEVYAKTHVYLGHWYGEKIREFVKGLSTKPDLLGIHGQTIFHQPDKNFTSQIGDGETIASYLDFPVVCNFRNKDVALGGQGAPLVPLGEKYLFPEHQLFLNLGGFANVSYKGLAFDTCSCNGVLNHIWNALFPDDPKGYDKNGSFAAGGEIDQKLLEKLNQLPYYQQKAPKSLGWEWVEAKLLPTFSNQEVNGQNLLATLVEHTAIQVAKGVELLQAKNQKMMVTGGGKHHSFLMDRLQHHLNPFEISIDHEIGDDWVDYKEAIIFAFLGLRLLEGKPTSLASVTGASTDVVGGSIHLPARGWRSLI
jgi:anhydro-N-acetylmuramic acid kinase